MADPNPIPPAPVEDIGQINPRTIEFTWVIEDFSFDQINIDDSLPSPVYMNSWKLVLIPKKTGDDGAMSDKLSVYLYNQREVSVTASVVFSILNSKKETVARNVLTPVTFERRGEESSSWGTTFPHYYLTDPLLVTADNGSLTIKCEICFDKTSDELDHEYEIQTSYQANLARCNEFDDYENLFKSEKSADVTFDFGCQELKAHRIILTSRSPVFNSMFAHDALDKKQNLIKIEDIDYAVFKEMLRYFYSGKINANVVEAKNLLIAADKYAVKGLKKMCEDLLANNLDDFDAIEYLSLADTYNAPGLMTRVTEYIKRKPYITCTPEYNEFNCTNPSLGWKVMVACIRALSDIRPAKRIKLENAE